MKLFGFLIDRASRKEMIETLAVPKYTRGEMQSFTEPRVDSNFVTNTLRRGFLNLDKQVVPAATADELKALAAKLEANEQLNEHRRYTGGDVLKVVVLSIIAQSGIPFSLSEEIIDITLGRAKDTLLREVKGEMAVIVTADGAGGYKVRPGKPNERGADGEWRLVVEIDRVIARFLRSAAPERLRK